MMSFRSFAFTLAHTLLLAKVLLLVSLSSTVQAKTAVLFGSTGAVGNDVLRSIVSESETNEDSFTKLILVGRKEFPPKVKDPLRESSLEVIEVIQPDLGTIDQNDELASMAADACLVATGSGFPANSDLHDWHHVEISMTKAIAKVCGSMNVTSISVFTAVSGGEARPYSDEELRKTNVPIGWMTVFSDTFRMMRLKEEAIISASKAIIPIVRIFMPSDIITKELRYGWLDWSIFKFHAIFDDWLPSEYHSVTTELLGEAMVKDSVNVLSGKTSATGVEFLKYDDFLKIVGGTTGPLEADEL
jgi:hypothetical protein